MIRDYGLLTPCLLLPCVCVYLTQRPESRQQVIAGRVQRRLETGSKNRPGSFTICSLILNSEDTRREVNAQQKPKTNRIPTRSLTSLLSFLCTLYFRMANISLHHSSLWCSFTSLRIRRLTPSLCDSHTGLGSSCSWGSNADVYLYQILPYLI